MSQAQFSFRPEDIEKLVNAVKKHRDTEAFSKLYDAFVTPLYRYVFFKVKNEEVEDIVETVFLKAWENIHQYKLRKNTSFGAWLFRIAHNLVVDHYRTEESRLEESITEFAEKIQDERVEHNPLKATVREFDSQVLKQALNKLSDSYRQIIVLKFLNELDNCEISQILHKSEGSLRILQHRALHALKDILKEMGFTA